MIKISDCIQPDRGQDATPIHLVNAAGFTDFAKGLSGGQRAALKAQKFDGSGYQVAIVPDGDGWFAVGGIANPASLSSWCLAKLAEDLPEGTYRLANGDPEAGPNPAWHGWLTAQYRFERYKKDDKAQGPRILLTKQAKHIDFAVAEAEAVMLVCDISGKTYYSLEWKLRLRSCPNTPVRWLPKNTPSGLTMGIM